MGSGAPGAEQQQRALPSASWSSDCDLGAVHIRNCDALGGSPAVRWLSARTFLVQSQIVVLPRSVRQLSTISVPWMSWVFLCWAASVDPARPSSGRSFGYLSGQPASQSVKPWPCQGTLHACPIHFAAFPMRLHRILIPSATLNVDEAN